MMKIPILLRNEIQMLFNQFKQTLKMPGTLLFYVITFSGVIFIGSVVTSFMQFSPIISNIILLIKDTTDRGTILLALGAITASSVFAGYFGIGPASVLSESDENVLMPAPVKPYQVFLSRYSRRIIRKIAFSFLGLLALAPLILSAHLAMLWVLAVLSASIIYLETNYLLGGISSYVRISVKKKFHSRLRHVFLLILVALILISSSPQLTNCYSFVLSMPSNAFGYWLVEITGIIPSGYGSIGGWIFLLLGFIISLLILAVYCDTEYYEAFTHILSKEARADQFGKVANIELDFTQSRFKDPMMWIILKDFWSRIRSPYYIWKYVYVVVGTLFVILLHFIQPSWLERLHFAPRISFASVPAFLLMLILMIQMSSVTSMLSFSEEKENIYLLKSSPYRPSDIIFAKYLLSTLEIGLAILPICGFLMYFMQVPGYFVLTTLAAPLVMIFAASGIAIGSYVPVFSNEPEILPVPLAFSFPTINLLLGFILVWITVILHDTIAILIVLPLFTLTLVLGFLGLAVRAFRLFR